MSGDLILHKRTLEPIKTLIYGLRRYDRDRCAALIDMDQIDPLTGQPPKVVGYMSHKATIYMVRSPECLKPGDMLLMSIYLFRRMFLITWSIF